MMAGRISNRMVTSLLVAIGTVVALSLSGPLTFRAVAQGLKEPEHVRYTSEFRMEKGTNRARISVTAEIEKKWHIYSITQPKGGPMATRIKVDPAALAKPDVPVLFQADRDPKRHIEEMLPAWKGLTIEEHEGKVVWTAPVELAEGFDPQTTPLNITVRGQVCEHEGACIPLNLSFVSKFAGNFDPVPPSELSATPNTAPSVSPNAEMPLPGKFELEMPAKVVDAEPVKVVGGGGRITFWWAVFSGLLGGMILNVMPCVLPVIGLKIIAFAKQAGHSRREILVYNLWYAAGLMLVFLVLATLAAFLNFGWSDQFKSLTFRYVMLGGVFAMGLSFFGVWEIPIPGFIGSGATNDLQEKSGYVGAFFKGIFTTILATPCSGPFLGGVFFYTVSAPWYETYVIFASIGLGMAMPFLLVGVNPALVKWLPKPGDWMETFKQFMGFVMMATSIFLFSTVNLPGNTIAVLVMLLGLAMGCWWIGRTPIYAEFGQKVQAWAIGCIMACAIIGIGFHNFAEPASAVAGNEKSTKSPSEAHLFAWQPFSLDALKKARSEGKTILIDFTASWCVNCHSNFQFAINTPEVKQVVEKNGVVAMLADWSNGDEEIGKTLRELGSSTIPFIAVYSAERPGEVIVLRDTVKQSQVVEALLKAGPSKNAVANNRLSEIRVARQ